MDWKELEERVDMNILETQKPNKVESYFPVQQQQKCSLV